LCVVERASRGRWRGNGAEGCPNIADEMSGRICNELNTKIS